MQQELKQPHQNEDIPIEMRDTKPKFQVSWQVIFVGLMFFYMYLPIVVLTFYSFNKSRYSAGWQVFTL